MYNGKRICIFVEILRNGNRYMENILEINEELKKFSFQREKEMRTTWFA